MSEMWRTGQVTLNASSVVKGRLKPHPKEKVVVSRAAHLALYSSSSSAEVTIIDAEPPKGTGYHAYPARERRPAADDRGRGSGGPPAPLQRPPRGVPMDGAVGGGDRKFYLGEHRGKTYQWVLDNRPDYIHWARQQVNPSQGLTHVMTWVEQNFIVEGDSVVLRAAVNQPPGEYQPRHAAVQRPGNRLIHLCQRGAPVAAQTTHMRVALPTP